MPVEGGVNRKGNHRISGIRDTGIKFIDWMVRPVVAYEIVT